MTLWRDDSLVLIDDNRLGAASGALLFREPRGAIEAHHAEEVAPALAALEAARQDGHHAAGFFSYELGYVLEPKLAGLLPPQRPVPLLSFGLFGPPERIAAEDVEAVLAADDFAIGGLAPAYDEAAYRARFKAVRDFITAGDVYQINLTFPLRFHFSGTPAALFAELRRTSRVPHGAFLALDGLSVLSLSPELFIAKQGSAVETRPMKGTAHRAPTLATDRAVRTQLADDPKNRAENLMIVDLLRNDLGRLAETGSVTVQSLFDIETYPTLHQMVSRIRATLSPTADLSGILTALFPSGSITGAPKIRAMEIIRALEKEPRGIYCGAIGHLAPDGDMELNVAIRTVTIDAEGRGTLGIGSGLVFDSEPQAEYEECLLKSAFLTRRHEAFALIESFRWTRAEGYTLLEEHLARLADSAAYFGFRHDGAEIRTQLRDAAERFAEARRVRLTLSEDGRIAITDAPLPPPAEQPMKVVLSAQSVSSSDPLLYHKTTRRALYEAEWARAQALHGADEVLFLNERGELAEGSRTNIFIERDGVLLTPALHCGLLPGTLRARLLKEGKAREAVLRPEDLERDVLYLGNAVRGLQRARFSPSI